jgi:hypothetical protein
MASERVTLGEEIPDDALRDVVHQVASGRVTPEQGWLNLQGRRAAKPRPAFETQFEDLLPYLSLEERHGSRYPYDTAGMGWRRAAVVADDLREAGLRADREAGLAPSPAAFRASGNVMGEERYPGWAELAEVYLFHSSYFPVLNDPDLDTELKNFRAAVARGELRIADYRREERRLLDLDRG